MRLLKVAAAVLNQTPLDWEGNARHIADAIAEARAQGATLLCLPELCITGYGCEDAYHSLAVAREAARRLKAMLPLTHGMIVSFGLPTMHQNGLFNTAALVADGKLLGFAAKRFLAGDGIHYEPRWFKPWPEGMRSRVDFDGEELPIGDLFFELGDIRIGFEICEDAWVATRPGGAMALRGIDILLNPSASHFAFGKFEVRKRFVLEGSRAFGASYVYTNSLGNEAGRAIYDGGALIASQGAMVATGPRFSFADVVVTTATIDIDATRMGQARTGSFQPRFDATDQPIQADFSFPAIIPEPPRATATRSPQDKREEFAWAEALALYDYLRKSRSKAFVVSISGGADSAAVATLCALAVRFGVADIGLDAFRAKLDHIPELAAAQSPDDVIRAILITVYQATANSSATTLEAARTVASGLGAEFHAIDVEDLRQSYTAKISALLGRELTWETDDIALQNIQARVRAPGIWLLTNIRNGLLLSTSNRSEAAVGYATMDGDTCGGLSPIAGIDKAFLLEWLKWAEIEGPAATGPIPCLAAVNRLRPTAELRPPSYDQTDEADLMPYPVLDAVERAAIRDKKSPLEVFLTVRTQFVDVPARTLAAWVTRFFRLWCRNQWKRERYAPSFHLDDENLDPKTWCRFPILSGGYEWELGELAEYVRTMEEPQT